MDYLAEVEERIKHKIEQIEEVSVKEGDLLGVIGPNGAGKTTLFSCMLGLLKDYRGEIRIFDQDKERIVLFSKE